MAEVLYGVTKVFLQEIDPDTELLLPDGVQLEVNCAESLEIEPQTDDGDEEVLRCPSTSEILAFRSTPDVTYAYELTLTDNQLDLEMLGLLGNAEIIRGSDGTTVIGVDAPVLGQAYEFRYFRLTVFVAAYTGASISGYVKMVFNKCSGTAQSFTFEQAFFAPEFTITATEASNAGLPVWQYRKVAVSELPDTIDDLEPIEPENPVTP